MIIKNKNISMTRGDSESIRVLCPAAPFESGDRITMTVREDAESEILLQIVVTAFDENGSALIALRPEDTEGLDFGSYLYDIELKTAGGAVTTLVTPHRFKLTEEVTD